MSLYACIPSRDVNAFMTQLPVEWHKKGTITVGAQTASSPVIECRSFDFQAQGGPDQARFACIGTNLWSVDPPYLARGIVF